jgi:hypothetical protein
MQQSFLQALSFKIKARQRGSFLAHLIKTYDPNMAASVFISSAHFLVCTCYIDTTQTSETKLR